MEHYVSQQKKQLLDSLENQVRFSRLVAVIVGDRGVGKSFLLMELQARLEQEVLVARVDAGLAMTGDQLKKTISLQLGLSWQDPHTPLEQQIKNNLNQKVLIAIDNAHRLSSSCQNYVLELNQNQLSFSESVIFILLAGDSSLPSMISETETHAQHQDMCVVFQVEPILQNETQPLIAAFGYNNTAALEGLYDEKKLRYFWQLSKGNPAELNYHVSRWIAEHSPLQSIELTQETPSSYGRSFLYVIIAIVLMVVLIYQKEINEIIAVSDTEKNDIGEGYAGKQEQVESKIEILRSPSDLSKQIKKKLEVEETDLEERLEPVDPQKFDLPGIGAVEEGAPIQEKLEVKQPLSEEPGKQTLTDTNKILLPAKVEEKNQAKKIDIKSEKSLAKNKVVRERVPLEKPKITETYLSEDEQELLLRDDTHYVLQWVAISKLKLAKSYSQRHKLHDKIKIYRRSSSNNALFLVVSDDFASREEAEKTRSDYKSSGVVGDPWTKSVKAVKKEIKAFQQTRSAN